MDIKILRRKWNRLPCGRRCRQPDLGMTAPDGPARPVPMMEFLFAGEVIDGRIFFDIGTEMI